MSPFAIIALVLILARAIAELWLSRLNERHVRAHADEVPPAFRQTVDGPTYSAAYCHGRLENSRHLSARPFWQWPVFSSLQALH